MEVLRVHKRPPALPLQFCNRSTAVCCVVLLLSGKYHKDKHVVILLRTGFWLLIEMLSEPEVLFVFRSPLWGFLPEFVIPVFEQKCKELPLRSLVQPSSSYMTR